MNSKKVSFVLMGALSLTMLLLFIVAYEANGVLGGASKNLSLAKAAAQAANDQTIQLTKNKQDITKYSELNTIAQKIVPQDKDQAEAVSEIVKIAGDSGIGQLSAITFPASTLGTVNTGSTVRLPPGLTQVTPVKGISGVYDFQITITQSSADEVPYNTFINFLSNLENNRRTAQVSSITVTPDSNKAGLVSFTLIIDEYIKP
jgi:hypothetical protein